MKMTEPARLAGGRTALAAPCSRPAATFFRAAGTPCRVRSLRARQTRPRPASSCAKSARPGPQPIPMSTSG
jgi:hypothetical protein